MCKDQLFAESGILPKANPELPFWPLLNAKCEVLFLASLILHTSLLHPCLVHWSEGFEVVEASNLGKPLLHKVITKYLPHLKMI